MAIRVNMFSRRETSEAQPRWKKGHPAHSTTGVANANWIQFDDCRLTSIIRPVRCPPISRANTGAVSARAIQKRRLMSASSALGCGSAVAVTGSSAMPQIGQAPGPACRICGCIGQV